MHNTVARRDNAMPGQRLAAALAEMVAAGEVTEAKALEFARGYLHDNAVGLYPAASP